jgi:plastocyanin
MLWVLVERTTAMRSTRFLLVAGLPLALVPFGCSKNTDTATTNTSAPATTAAAAGGGGAGGTVTVTIKDFKFGPDPVTVKSGQTITFTNQDDSPHEPTSGTPSAKTDTFDVTTKAKASEVTKPITLAPGTYDYFCSLHEYMVAKITVQ